MSLLLNAKSSLHVYLYSLSIAKWLLICIYIYILHMARCRRLLASPELAKKHIESTSWRMSNQTEGPVVGSQGRKAGHGQNNSSATSQAVTRRLQSELMSLMVSGTESFVCERESDWYALDNASYVIYTYVFLDGFPTWLLFNFILKRQTSSDAGISAFPEGDNILCWVGTIEGSKGTVFDGCTYKLTLEFPNDYPYKPPTVKFKTPCFHPNVDNYGNICLDILQDKWSAVQNVRSILVSIQSLLGGKCVSEDSCPMRGFLLLPLLGFDWFVFSNCIIFKHCCRDQSQITIVHSTATLRLSGRIKKNTGLLF